MYVLQTAASGYPQTWLNLTDAATLLVAGRTLWTFGSTGVTLHGGRNKSGQQSLLEMPAIIATKGNPASLFESGKVPFSRRGVFARDARMCLYCGAELSERYLTIDHIHPVCLGGKNTWENAATACKPCNNLKGNRLLKDLGWSLRAVPYAPNRYEYLFLKGRSFLTPDQEEYLAGGFSHLVL